MNDGDFFESELYVKHPEIEIIADRPKVMTGSTFYDIELKGKKIVVEWKPGTGFGLTKKPEVAAYGDGPEEIYITPESVLSRIDEILKT
jgi:hypothetical protein